MSITKSIPGTAKATIQKYTQRKFEAYDDLVAEEAPLLISIKSPNQEAENLVITMHTAVHTEDLVRGFLYTEGIINKEDHIDKIELRHQEAIVSMNISPINKSKRNTVSTAACGMCGKTELDAIDLVRTFDLDTSKYQIQTTLLLEMDHKMSHHQQLFEATGGIHAAALFDFEGQLKVVREDIGRHNAVDKVIGNMLLTAINPAETILFVSGRAGFELVQKALVSGISMMVAVGAPSSLAVDYAVKYGMTLIGFMQKQRFNVYSHPKRILQTA